MIKAIGIVDGQRTLIIGLSFANLDFLRTDPKGYIRVKGKDTGGLPVDVMIIAGETEAHIVQTLEPGIDEATQITTDPGMKN